MRKHLKYPKKPAKVTPASGHFHAARTQQLHRANQTLKILSRCNRALVKATNERKLIQTICKLVYSAGCYDVVWMGFALNDKERNIDRVAIAGDHAGFLTGVKVTWGTNSVLGKGPSGTAIRTGRPCLVTLSRHVYKLAPWVKKALHYNLRSGIAIPLTHEGQAFGVLTLYSKDLHAFDAPQAGLLKEMADNLAYGIIALRAGRERDKVFAELQRKNELLRILASELTTVEERERRRMALMLHDELQQQLVGARYNVQFLQHQEDCGKYKHIIERIDDTLKSCLDHSRLLISELSPRVLYELGLGPAVQWLAHEYHEKHGIKVTVSTSPIPQIDEDIAITLFQAVRELLFNVVKHAQVKTASVQLSLAPSGKIQTIVSDHGSGFEPIRLGTAKPMTSGFGLFSMKERLASMGGEIKIKSATNRGTRITITIPPKAVKKRPAFGKTLKKTLFRQSDYNLNPL